MLNQPAHHLLTILVLVLSTALPITAAADAPLELILVRHAEKVDKSAGSGLTTLGEHRANNLARLLQDDAITHVFSTPYNRTLLTAKPVADHHHLPVIEYDASSLSELAEKLRDMEGVVLVIGHSNTTPILANHLLGTDFTVLDDHIYDQVFVVSISRNGDATLNMLYTEPRTP